MRKIAFLFPGQGSQKVGMGKSLYENYEICKKVFDEANSVLDFDLIDLCFNDKKNEINLTMYSQPAILAHSIAALELLKSENINYEYTAGLSLGEYSALYLENVFNLKIGIDIVYNRGKFMMNACENTKGTMAAIIGLERDKLMKICNEMDGICEIANFNCPGQMVISGDEKTIESACKKAKENGAKRTMMLNVSGPFHSSLLKEAGENLFKYIENIKFNEPSEKILMNVTGGFYKENLKELLKKQVSSSIYFEDAIKEMVSNGVDTFIEIGPGRVLSGFVKKIDRTLTTLNIEDKESFEKTISILRGE